MEQELFSVAGNNFWNYFLHLSVLLSPFSHVVVHLKLPFRCCPKSVGFSFAIVWSLLMHETPLRYSLLIDTKLGQCILDTSDEKKVTDRGRERTVIKVRSKQREHLEHGWPVKEIHWIWRQVLQCLHLIEGSYIWSSIHMLSHVGSFNGRRRCIGPETESEVYLGVAEWWHLCADCRSSHNNMCAIHLY